MRWLLKNFELLISGVAFSVMVLVICLNVISRAVFSYSLPFAEELAYLGFDYSVFFGACALYRMHALIAVTIVADHLPARWRHYLALLNFVFVSASSAYLSYLSWSLAAGSWVRRSPYLQYPYFYVYIAPTIALALMSLYSVYFLVVHSRKGPAHLEPDVASPTLDAS